MDPEQAVQIHMDVKSKRSVAIHWGTFALAKEVFYFRIFVKNSIFILIKIEFKFYLEPKSKLREAVEKFKLDNNSFVTMEHGKIYEF